jgi:general secretion pathway protein C
MRLNLDWELLNRMRSSLAPRFARGGAVPFTWIEGALVAVLAVQAARLFWAIAAPLGPVGAWQVPQPSAVYDPALPARFDPFFRLARAAGPVVVTSVPLTLFGVRVDQASGRGAAIIATPDGVQSSFAIGDAIMPGIILKAVAVDGVTIDRGGISEQLFLDQSVAVPAVPPPGTNPAATTGTVMSGNAMSAAPAVPAVPAASAPSVAVKAQ